MANEKVPQVIEGLVGSMLDQNDSVHARTNYRMRLEVIRDYISQAMVQYDGEKQQKAEYRQFKKDLGYSRVGAGAMKRGR